MPKFLPSCYQQGRGQGHTLCSRNPLFPTNHVAREKTIGPPEKPHPLVLNKAETMKFDGGSSRVGKVVDSVLQTSVGRPQDDELD